MSSRIAAELVGANPGPGAHLALLGGIVVVGLVIFALDRWRKRREGQAEDELPTHDLSVANEPGGGTGEAARDEHNGGTA